MDNFIQVQIPFKTELEHAILPSIDDDIKDLGPLHMNLNDRINYTSRYELPIVKKVNMCNLPERLCTLRKMINSPASSRRGCCIHFFTDDKNIEPLWTRPQMYVSILSRFDYVLSPDLSLYMDMVRPQKWWNDFRNKFLAAYFQNHNSNIIPAPSWADLKDIERYAEGWPHKSLIAINSTGIGTDKRAIFNWLDGYHAMVDILQPVHILRYGRMIEGEFSEISTYYENNNKKGYYYGGKRLV